MPKHWIRIEYGWNPHPELFDLQKEVYRIVAAGDGGLDELLGEPDTDYWHVIVHATDATRIREIEAGFEEAGFKPTVIKEGLNTTEETAIRLSGAK